MSLGTLQLFHKLVCNNNIQTFPCFNTHMKLCFSSIWKKNLQFNFKSWKELHQALKLDPLLILKIIGSTSKHLRYFWRKIYCCEKSLCSIYDESLLQRPVSYIAETLKCNLNYASFYQLYIEDSPWIEQSNISCDSYDCIKLHTLVAFCQPNGTVSWKY